MRHTKSNKRPHDRPLELKVDVPRGEIIVVRADDIAQALTERNETGDEDADEESGT